MLEVLVRVDFERLLQAPDVLFELIEIVLCWVALDDNDFEISSLLLTVLHGRLYMSTQREDSRDLYVDFHAFRVRGFR